MADLDASSPGPLQQPRVQLHQVGVRYGKLPVLEQVDLQFPVDGRTVVLGPNGAGKTTLLQAIHGLIPLSDGQITGCRANGEDFRPRFGFVFQRPVMLRRSALANVEHALAVFGVTGVQRSAQAVAAIQDLGLGHLLDRPARRLSGGEQQRLAIARANALEPDCLLLDEPTAHVDPAAGAALERYLLRMQQRGRGFVMSTHDLAQARRLADLVIFMHAGRVLEVSPAAEFFNQPRSAKAAKFLAGEWLD